MKTTVRINQKLRKAFTDVEDTNELSEQTKRDIKEARRQIKEGKFHRWEDIKKEIFFRQ